MSVHAFHPSIVEAGLSDECQRCAEIAADPVNGLDDTNFRLLVGRTILWMRDEDFPRTDTEAVAMRKIEDHLTFCRRMGWKADALVAA